MESRDDDFDAAAARRRSPARTVAIQQPQPAAVAPRGQGVPPWAVIMIAALACGLGIAIGRGTSTTPAAVPQSATPAETTAAAKTAAKTAAPAAKTVVLHQSGNGIKTTQDFTTGSAWSVAYTFDCSNFGSKGNFAITETGALGDVLANALDSKGADKTYQHDSGQHSLQINSECAWTITVTDGDDG